MISQLLKLFGVNNITKLALVFLVFSLSGIIALYASDILTTFMLRYIDNNISPCTNFILAWLTLLTNYFISPSS